MLHIGAKRRSFFFALLLSIAAAFIFDSPEHAFLYHVAVGFLGVGLILILLAPGRMTLFVLLLLSVAGRDLVLAEDEAVQVGSLWNFRMGVLNPGMIFFCILVLTFVKVWLSVGRRARWFPKFLPLYFGFVVMAASVGYGTLFENMAATFTDLRTPLILIFGLATFVSALEGRLLSLEEMFYFLLAVLAGRHLVDLAYFVERHDEFLAGTYAVSFDSAKAAVFILFFYAVYRLFFARPASLFMGSLLGLGSLMLIIVYFNRTFWITGLLGVAIVASLGSFTRRTVIIGTVGLGVFLAYLTAASINPLIVPSLRYYAESLSLEEPGFTVTVRSASIKNAFIQQINNRSLLWGEGYGSSYSDRRVPFPAVVYFSEHYHRTIAGTGFGLDMIRQRRFYRVHDFFFHTMFKYGLCGLVLILLYWLKPGFRCWKWLRDHPAAIRAEMVVLLGMVPVSIGSLNWSGKGVFLSSVLMSFLIVMAKQIQKCGASTGAGEKLAHSGA